MSIGNVSIEDLSPHFGDLTTTPAKELTKILATEGVGLTFGKGSSKIDRSDIGRVHSLTALIDSRRAFYAAWEDEMPEHVTSSILRTREDLIQIFEHPWVDPWTRKVVQKLRDELNEFLTRTGREPIPRLMDRRWPKFEAQLLRLRLVTWLTVAHLTKVYGHSVEASNMPKEIAELVDADYS